jgi:MoxR-like ATPase
VATHRDLRRAGSPAEVAAALADHGYLADHALATVVHLALAMRRPLLLEGEPGVGKTEVARTVAAATGGELIRLQCHEGIDVGQAVYEWDFSRQILHLRAAEAAAGIAEHHGEQGTVEADPAQLEDALFTERYLVARPLLRAIHHEAEIPPVLLVDEVDRADDEFEAFLLEALSDYSVTVPELGTFTATEPPVVVLTSNRTRDVHDALRRRCLYHWVEHPDLEREVRIVTTRAPQVPVELARQVATVSQRFRELGLYKPPGVAETIDWAVAISTLGIDTLDVDVLRATMGTVLKYREDQDRVGAMGLAALVGTLGPPTSPEAGLQTGLQGGTVTGGDAG